MANNILFTNNASALLAASISSSDTTVQVASGFGALFPSPSGDEYFYATLVDDNGDIEIVKCTSRTGDNLTVERGQEGTTAQGFTLTVTRVELRLTAAGVGEFLQKNGGAMTGDLDMNENNLVDAILTGSATSIQAGEVAGVPIRGATGVTGNQIVVPSNGTDNPTVGGVAVVLADDTATESATGVIELATQAEVNLGTDTARAVTPATLANAESLLQATESQRGALEIATEAETNTGTDDTRAVTPLKLASRTATETRAGVVELATQSEVDDGTDTERAVTPATLAGSSLLFSGLPTFTGTSTLTGLTAGKKYLVHVYGTTRSAGNDTATLGGVRVGDGASVGSGTELANTGTESINWMDGQAPQSATLIVTATSASINGTVDYVNSGTYRAAKYMCAVQLD
jgi:hypothetical protein